MMKVQIKVWLEDRDQPVFGEGRRRLLEAVQRYGSINRAAAELGQPYRKAWASLTAMEQRLGIKLLERHTGGVSGGGSRLTEDGLRFLNRYGELMSDLRQFTMERSGLFFLDRYAGLHSRKKGDAMIDAAVLTVSDSCSTGTRNNESGRVLEQLVASLPGKVECSDIVPDEIGRIQERIRHYSDVTGVDLVLTTGGTGISPRDVTPEATAPLLDRLLPGLPEAMRAAGMQKTPYAMLTRGVAGIRGNSVVVNFPGSPRAVKENFEAVRPVLVHLIEKCQGDTSPCAQPEAVGAKS